MKATRLIRPSIHGLAALGFAMMLCQCAAPISVRQVTPAEPEPKSAVDALTIDHVHQAYTRLGKGDNAAAADYNYWVGRLVEELEESGADPWGQKLGLSSPGGIRTLRGRKPATSSPVENRLILADTLEFRGKLAAHRKPVPGVGAPLVEVSSFEGIGHEETRTNLPLHNLTALVRFKGKDATIELVDPYQVENVSLGGRRYRLAADPAAASMLGMSKARIDRLGFARLVQPARYNDTAHLNFLQPYDPDRIPVLMVHGLQDTPATWAPAYFELIKDPEIRENYQFWVFSYPSGYPYPYSASLLRREMDGVNREFPDHKDIVIIGHSMGGIITRLMVTDAGDKIWRKAFGKSPSETEIRGNSRDILESAIIFNHRKEIDRAIFISAPHQGSILASNWIGAIGTRLIRLPSFMADVRDTMVSAAGADASGMMMQRAPNSIDTLSPDNFFVKEVNKIPITPGVPYHSIVGDRGKGDTPDSSDGVVAYWSSHLDGAESEKIVPSGHMANQHPEGIEEIHRILLLHLKETR